MMGYYYDLFVDNYVKYDTITIFHYNELKIAYIRYFCNGIESQYQSRQFAEILTRILNAKIEICRTKKNKKVLIRSFKNAELKFLLRHLQNEYEFGLNAQIVDKYYQKCVAVSAEMYSDEHYKTVCNSLKKYCFPEEEKIITILNDIK